MTPTPTEALIRDINAATPDTPRTHLRALVVRARRLNRADMIPEWINRATTAPAQTPARQTAPAPAPAPAQIHDPESVITAKSQQHSIPAPVLRTVYCRELTSDSAPPENLSRTACAQARVNSFIRLSQGDPDARSDDADLLVLLGC